MAGITLGSSYILAIESSCDETACSVVRGTEILSSVVASQLTLHAKWGGVVPEAASRAHVEAIIPVVSEALSAAKISLSDIEAFASTNRPGLLGALSIGVAASKALAFEAKKPWFGIHHLEGHLWSVMKEGVGWDDPFIGLIASGGHTELVKVAGIGAYTLLGETRDDAAGEAFDKIARLIGLGAPGGLKIQEEARTASGHLYSLPVADRLGKYEFSYSGLKTACLRLIQKEGASLKRDEMAHAVQQAIVRPLVEKSILACESEGLAKLVVGGGVAANLCLRASLHAEGAKRGVEVAFPPIELCGDNAAMIGLVASMRFELGLTSPWEEDCLATSPLPSDGISAH